MGSAEEAGMLTALALDTTSATQALAVAGGKTRERSFSIPRDGSHTETLLENIDQLLRDIGLAKSRLDCVGAVTGPGSFTGIRIGLAVACGLADGLDIPLIGRNALELAALDPSLPDGWIAPVRDAWRGKLFSTIFRRRAGELERVVPYLEVTETELVSLLSGYEGIMITGAGGGSLAGFTARNDLLRARITSGPEPNLAAILAAEIVRHGRPTRTEPLEAFYIRPPDARLPARVSLQAENSGGGPPHVDP